MSHHSLNLPIFWGLFLAAVFIFLNGFFVAAEFAIVKVRRTRIDELAAQGNWKAKITLKIVDRLDEYLSATQLGITLASIALGWIGEPAVAQLLFPLFKNFGSIAEVSAHSLALFLAFGIIVLLHVILGELVPKSIAIQKADAVSLLIAYPLWLFDKLFFPFLLMFNKTSNAIVRLLGFRRSKERPPSEEELRLILLECSKEGIVTPQELSIIRHALTFSDKRAKDIFIPKEKISFLKRKDPFEIQYQKVSKVAHTRLPVLDEETTSIIGFVRLQDMLIQDPESYNLQTILRPILEVSELTKIDQIFQMMKEKKIYIACVLDKKRQWLGIVTMGDIIEEIFGNI